MKELLSIVLIVLLPTTTFASTPTTTADAPSNASDVAPKELDAAPTAVDGTATESTSGTAKVDEEDIVTTDEAASDKGNGLVMFVLGLAALGGGVLFGLSSVSSSVGGAGVAWACGNRAHSSSSDADCSRERTNPDTGNQDAMAMFLLSSGLVLTMMGAAKWTAESREDSAAEADNDDAVSWNPNVLVAPTSKGVMGALEWSF